MAELPIAPFERLLKKAGAGRVSEDAAERLRDTVEEQTLEIARKAVSYASHAKRKTVRKEDVVLAKR
ncbi:MAG: histone family protein [archaeon]|jgi:histone H3/H4|nr:histone [Euryarchaeota archaeon]MDP6527545.1 histone family protein [Candidatus Paceibacterota bacterium]MDP6704001.1 histone family protein [archaeon]MDP7260556.1 histone family protein [archaeon]HIK01461.1 histone family protein [Candidatus Undinarchaeales archaeon ERR594346 U_76725]|tara:strand:- start:23295 stop:23495 length:201 start_codon:yes stop_codon:yes gene_type:complete